MSAELPSGGWPVGTLIELLVQQSGIAELRLLRPALAAVGKRPIALVQPVQIPNSLAFSYLGVDPSKLLWLRTSKSADALWTVEQILKAGSCGAVLFLAAARPLRITATAAACSTNIRNAIRHVSAARMRGRFVAGVVAHCPATVRGRGLGRDHQTKRSHFQCSVRRTNRTFVYSDQVTTNSQEAWKGSVPG